jgi:hypothetical protein
MTEVPSVVFGVNTQPVAVPMFEKSTEEMPVTDSEKLMVNARDIPAAGDVGSDAIVAVGRVTSIVIGPIDVSATGPFCCVDCPKTEFANCVKIRVPLVTDEPVAVTRY